MSRHRTYRVIVTNSETYSIDLAASSEAIAISRAERLWHVGMRCKFGRVDHQEVATFAVDELSTMRLGEISNEDRALWAKNALRAFSKDTGSDMGREALHDLLCDLGHYARSTGLDFRDEMRRAADVWGEEIAEEVQS